MDSLCLSFPFPAHVSASAPKSALPSAVVSSINQNQSIERSDRDLQDLQSQYQSLCDEVMRAHNCTITLQSTGNTLPSDYPYTVTISGRFQDVYYSRAILLGLNPAKTCSFVRASRGFLLTPMGELNPGMKTKLDAIMLQTRTQISVRIDYTTSVKPLPGMQEETTALEISGTRESVEVARLRLLVLFDELSGLFVDTMDIDPKMHNIIAGRKGVDLHYIMHTTNTNIYLPSPFNVHQYLLLHSPSGWEHHMPEGSGTIVITGEQQERVQQAKDMLAASICSKSISNAKMIIMTKKIDWMLTQRKDLLLRFMSDNATFIAFPPIGSTNNLVTVYGGNQIFVQRTLRALARLSCDFYVASIRIILPAASSPRFRMPMSPINSLMSNISTSTSSTTNGIYETPIKIPLTAQLSTLLGQISQSSGAEVVFNDSVFEFYGADSSVAAAYQYIADLDFVKRPNRETRFRIELGTEHRDFISGKKNGKINKIIKQTGVKINFEEWNEHNMIIDLSTPFLENGLESFGLIKDELPAEISFYVPEQFHKRIIGVGGRNIQGIMKKYGVFVKFSNVDEHVAMGGYFDNDDNVIARTPAKNSHNLIELKHAVVELVNPQQHEMINFLASVPLRHHRLLETTMQAIETTAAVKIRIPNRETGNDEIMIKGYEPNVKLALNLLADCMPEAYELRLMPSSDLIRSVVFTVGFKSNMVDKVKNEFGVDLYVQEKSMNGTGTEMVFTFRGPRKSTKYLSGAKDMLINYLAARNVYFGSITMNGSNTNSEQLEAQLRRVESIPGAVDEPNSDSFRHFDTKLIASTITATDSSATVLGFSSYSLFDSNQGANGSSKAQFAGSAPNLRALFDNNTLLPVQNVQEIQRSDIDIHISPTTAAELPFLKPDKWGILSLTKSQSMNTAISDSTIGKAVNGNSFSVFASSSLSPTKSTTMLASPSSLSTDLRFDLGINFVPGTPRQNSSGVVIGLDKVDSLDELTNHVDNGIELLQESRQFVSSEPITPTRVDTSLSDPKHDYSPPTPPELSPLSSNPILTSEMIEHILEMRDKSNFAQLRLLFQYLKMNKYLNAFIEQEVDFNALVVLQESDLKEIGVTALGTRRKLMVAISKLRNMQSKNDNDHLNS